MTQYQEKQAILFKSQQYLLGIEKRQLTQQKKGLTKRKFIFNFAAILFFLICTWKIFPYLCKQNNSITPITYIWMGSLPMPNNYIQIASRADSQLIGQQQYLFYVEQWNKQEDIQIQIQNYDFVQKVDMLKLLHLYFHGGIYSDFDYLIDRSCFEKVDFPDDQILWTSKIKYQGYTNAPEESFMKVKTLKNPMVKRMLISEILKKDRWIECLNRPCFIVQCSKHAYDDLIYKGKN